jgi:ribonuclease P/MRP protein subunit RPP40
MDLVLSSDDSMVQSLEVGEPFESSDHQVIRLEIVCEKKVLEKNIKIYDYFKADYNEIRKYAASLNWNSIKDSDIIDVDGMWKEIKVNLSDIREKFIELKKKSKNKCKWVTKRVTRFRRAKKKAWNNYINSGKDTVLYEVYKKKLKDSINENKKAKQNFEEKLANNIKNDSKSFYYAYVGSKKKANNKIGPLRDNSKQILISKTDNANLLNTYFSSVFTVENVDSIPISIEMFSGNSDQTLTDIQITENIVLEKLNIININKCQGSGQIHPKLLYELRNEIVKPLTKLFRVSLQLSIVPQDWKEANVAPLHKKGSREKPENYRPVSLTSIIGKIAESIIKDNIVAYLDIYNLIKSNQHGFTKGKSCLTNLLDFFEEVTKDLDEGKSMDLIYLDFSKAFDKVPYERLFKKLESHGIRGATLRWIKNWLSDRRQRVCIDGEYSEWAKVTSGVSQGSVLGPILFIIFINDLDSNIISKLDKFADDSKLGKSICSHDDVECLRKDLTNMENWCNDWQMKFNTEKCKVMHLGKNNPVNQYMLDNKNLEESGSERDLGVIIDKSLKFSEHCNKVANTANAILGMIKRTINCKSKSIITRLYKALVRPQLEYCVQVWRPYLKKDIEKIEKVQRRATKLISDCSKLSYEDRLKSTGLTTLEARRTRGDLIEVFKIVKGFSKVDYKHFFQLADNSKTRGNKYKLVKSRSRLDIRKHFFSQRVLNEWNKLPNSVVEAESVNSFKNKYDNYISTQNLV